MNLTESTPAGPVLRLQPEELTLLVACMGTALERLSLDDWDARLPGTPDAASAVIAQLQAYLAGGTVGALELVADTSTVGLIVTVAMTAVDTEIDRDLAERGVDMEAAERLSSDLFRIYGALPRSNPTGSLAVEIRAVGSAAPAATAPDDVEVVPVHTDGHDGLDAQLDALHLGRSTLVAYMKAAPLVMSARGVRPDRRDPAAKRIPIGFRSDGEWVWTLEAERYVERDGMEVPQPFLERVALLGTPPELDEAVRHHIADILRGGGPA